jgi:hypothetical protein
MNSVPPRTWLILMCVFRLINNVAANVNITYPTKGLVYPSKGPDAVEWLYTRYGFECIGIGIQMLWSAG